MKKNHLSLTVYSLESSSVKENEQFYEIYEVEDTQVRVQLDSDAKANVMLAKTYNNLKHGSLPPLKKTNTVMISFSKHKLKPHGEVVLTTRYKDQVEDVRFFVVPGVKSVLSGNTCIKVGLLKRVHQITSQNPRARRELDT